MKAHILFKILAVLSAFFFASAALAQNAGTVTANAFAIGQGAGKTGYASLLCGSAQLAVGQSAAKPICQSISGDATLSAAGALTLATVNANVGTFGSATQCVTVTNNAKGLTTAISAATCTPAVSSITGLGAGVAAALGIATNGAGGFVTSPVANANLATMAANTFKANGTAGTAAPTDISCAASAVVGRNASGNLNCQLILDNNIFSGAAIATTKIAFGTGVATAAANALNASGGLVGFSGALGTPTSGILTNATGLPLSGLTTQAANTIVANAAGSAASPTAVDISTLTSKASPAAGDFILLSDQAAAGALKRATVSSIASAGSVASVGGLTGAIGLGSGLGTSGSNVVLNNSMGTSKIQVFSTGGSTGTITVPTGAAWAKFTMVGAGGPGAGSGTATGSNPSGGGPTCISLSGAACTSPVYQAGGGNGGNWTTGTGPSGGTCSGSGSFLLAVAGADGFGQTQNASTGISVIGLPGGDGPFGFGHGGSIARGASAGANASGFGSGGQGGSTGATASSFTGPSGSGGAGCIAFIQAPAASYTYAVGSGNTGGTAGTNGFAGGNSAGGLIIAEFGFN